MSIKSKEEYRKVIAKRGDGRVENLCTGGMIIYGAGEHLQDMLSWYNDLAGRITRVIDKDTAKIGKKAPGLSCEVESPEVLKELPAGTWVVVSALRYYNEIIRELHEMNPGLVCPNIDQAYTLMKQAEANGLLVYGVGEHLDDMLFWHPELMGRISRIFDKDETKQGKKALETDILVEGLEKLKYLPAGTKIAISAIRYYQEIAKELSALNPGLICQDIDDVYTGLAYSLPVLSENEVANNQQKLRDYVYFDNSYDFSLLHQKKYIGILTTKHCVYIAELLKHNISIEGFDCEIFIGSDKMDFESEDLYIVICPQMYRCLPQNYIAFQLEQSVNSRWFNNECIAHLKRSVAIFDFSLTNIEYLQTQGIPSSKIFYMPISPSDKAEKIENHKYEYDVLFCGDIHSDRREKFLDKIQEKFDVKIISNLFGEELKRELQKARIVLNIHFYEGAVLETTRISEVLSLGTSLIVSERSSEENLDNQFKDCVDFVEVNDVDTMIERLEYWLSDLNRLERKMHSVNSKKKNIFPFFFKRFLLAKDLISFDDFYNQIAGYFNFEGKKICLNLPESVDRKNILIP